MGQTNGAIIYDGPSRLDDERIIAIVTGLSTPSNNTKTHDMLHVWILLADIPPIEAISTGADSSICGHCALRPILKHAGKPCYVIVPQAPRSIWLAWSQGSYPTMRPADIPRSKPIRMGAYGDPGAVPSRIWHALSGRHTGYTHQWRRRPSLKTIMMASVDSAEEAREAQALGFRTFRTRTSKNDPLLSNEIACPASVEAGRRTTCDVCLLCDGAKPGDTRRSIATILH